MPAKPNHRVQIARLGKQIDALSKALAGLGKTDDLKELLRHIKQPGWTTPAELIFALGITESLIAQIGAIGALRGTLVKGGGAVTAG